jgi:lipopolysaccharide export system permease protein
MRTRRVLAQYVLCEVSKYGALGLLGVGSILLSQNLLRRLEDLAFVDLGVADAFVLGGCLVAMLAAYTLPVAFLFGVLVAFGRLSADSEITAMRTLGVSLAQVSFPVVALSVAVALLTAWLLGQVEPDARRRLHALGVELATRGGIFQPGQFRRLDRMGARVLFADRLGATPNDLEGVLIADQSDPARPFTIVAERAHFSFDPATATARLALEAGDVHFVPSNPQDEDYHRIAFERFFYSVDMGDVIGADRRHLLPSEMRTGLVWGVLGHFEREGRAPEWSRVQKREPFDVELARRLAIPVAPVFFALLGVPLGLRRSRGARSWGALICVALVFLYYALLSFGSFLAREGRVPALVGLWIPNLCFATAALVACLRARNAEI